MLTPDMQKGQCVNTGPSRAFASLAKGDPMTVARSNDKTLPSAIAALDVTSLADAAESGQDPFPVLVAAVLSDLGRPLSDLYGFLPASACSEVEAFMTATGSAAGLEASR